MKATTFILAAYAALANAQDSDACRPTAVYTVTAQADVGNIAGCPTFTGSIALATQALGQINIGNIRAITGDLVADGAVNLTSLGADSLESIGGAFTLNNLVMLNSLPFPFLDSVGDLSFKGLPNLNTFSFSAVIKSIKSIDIENTFLSSLNGLNPSTLASVTIANNNMLQTFSSQVSSIIGDMNFLSNGNSFAVQLPNLQTARNISFLSVSTVDIPSLMNVSGNLVFNSNRFGTLSAVNLTSVGQTLAINTNPNLYNISLPVLKTINGGFQVQNNTNLTVVDMPALETIGGAFDFYGNLTSVSLPALKNNRGGFNLQSSADIDCGAFQRIAGSNSVIKGVFKCVANSSHPGNISTSGGSGSSANDAMSSMTTNVMLLGVSGLLAAIVSFL